MLDVFAFSQLAGPVSIRQLPGDVLRNVVVICFQSGKILLDLFDWHLAEIAFLPPPLQPRLHGFAEIRIWRSGVFAGNGVQGP